LPTEIAAGLGALQSPSAATKGYLPDFGFALSPKDAVAEGFGFSAFGFFGSRPLRCWPLAMGIS